MRKSTREVPKRILSVRATSSLRPCAWALVMALSFLASATDLRAQTAVVKRTVILREGPATTTTRLARLEKNDELTLLDPPQVDGFYNVRVANGDVGWVYGAYIRVLTTSPLPTTPTGPPKDYRSCPLEGNAVAEFRQESNKLKNRVTAHPVTSLRALHGGTSHLLV